MLRELADITCACNSNQRLAKRAASDAYYVSSAANRFHGRGGPVHVVNQYIAAETKKQAGSDMRMECHGARRLWSTCWEGERDMFGRNECIVNMDAL